MGLLIKMILEDFLNKKFNKDNEGKLYLYIYYK